MSVIAEPVSISIESILVATDFSRASENALTYSKALALRFGATLEVTNVFDSATVNTYEEAIMGFPNDYRRKAAADNLDQLEYELKRDGLSAQVLTADGCNPGEVLLQIAKHRRIDLIIAGTHAKTDWEKIILGSTAEELIRGADCPVLTVGPKARNPGTDPMVFRTIVYATDFSPQANRAAIYALSFAEDCNAHLHLCHVLPAEAETEDERRHLEAHSIETLRKLIPEGSYDWCSPVCDVLHGDPSAAILGLAQKVDADLIVVGARKSSFWLKHIERGLTPQLLAEALCPVLTVC